MYDRAPLSDVEEQERPSPAARSYRGLVATSAFAAAGALALCLGSRRAEGRGAPLLEAAGSGAVVELLEDPDDPCANYPFISFDSVLHSNLGNQGPGSGAEGIVYKATDYKPGSAPEQLLVVVNASASYKAGHPKYNGIHGKYGLITMKPGHETDIRIRILDPATMQPKTLAKQEFTFFDLDQSFGGANREYLKVSGSSQVWLTRNTEIEITDLPGGAKQFMSSQQGSGHDNPKDPSTLTVQQKNRAVTLEFRDFSELTVTLGCTMGQYARYFMFVARPSLLCAQTLGAAQDGEDKPVPVQGTTPTPTTLPATTTSPPDCLYVIPFVEYCVPKAWKFW